MGKGLRAKSNRRYRTAKRHVVDECIEVPRTIESFKKVQMLHNGQDITPVTKVNMFLYPDDKDAVIPQRFPKPALDLRSNNVPYSGIAGPYNRRKYTDDELISLTTSMEIDGKNVESTRRMNKIKSKTVNKFKKRVK